MRVIVCLLAMVWVVAARPRAGCVAPTRMEAAVFGVDHMTHLFSRGYMAYDGENERVRRVDLTYSNGTESSYDSLFLFKSDARYTVDMKTKKCTKSSIGRKFLPIEVHPNSTFMGEAILGSLSGPGTGVQVQNWGHKDADGYDFQVFTSHGCIPVEMLHYSEKYHFHYEYLNVTTTIRDEKVFDVPKECM